MKKLLVLTSALLICGASLASAAAPGGNLTWNTCSTLASAGNYAFTCDDNTLTRNLVTSFQLATPLADFVGISATIDYALGDPGTPDYFQYGPGGCREGALGPINVGNIGGCTNPYAGTAGQAGGFVLEQTAPNKWRIRADWARADIGVVNAAQLTSALVMQLNTNGAFDEGFGVCAGCEVPACYVLNSLEVFGLNTGLAATITGADFRNYATYQGGGVGGTGCPGETPAKNTTWGAVKALYR